jgi:hypothetical protein
MALMRPSVETLPAVRISVMLMKWRREEQSGEADRPANHQSEDGPTSLNRVGGGVIPPPPTPPDMRVRIRRFAKHPERDGTNR